MTEVPFVASSRGIAWHVLERVERHRAYADLALNGALRDAKLERRDRALATEIAYGALRARGRLDHVLGQVLDRPLAELESPLRNLLRIGAYQLLEMDRVPTPAVVDESVELAKRGGFPRASGLVNAVLRSVARLRDDQAIRWPDPEAEPVEWLASRGSLPRWLAERLVRDLGAREARSFAEACGGPPPRTVRVTARGERESLLRELGGKPTHFAPNGITGVGADPARTRSFERGEITVQDEASQLVPLLLGAQPGETVVDCCAAPGGKAAQLAEIVGPRGEVIALELHRTRIALIHKTAERLGLTNLRMLERDVSQGFDLKGRLSYPRVLVDAPCSGLGTLRRNPDARWQLREDEIPRMADRALAILASAARYVDEGGVLVYSVCTLTPEETVGVISRFCESHPEFHTDDPRPHLPPAAAELVNDANALVTLPHRHGCDGFFAARLVRRA